MFSIKTPVIMDSAFIDINYQLDLLLNYLEREKNVDKESEEEGLTDAKVNAPEHVGVNDDQSNKPLDLSFLRNKLQDQNHHHILQICPHTHHMIQSCLSHIHQA